MRGTQIAHISIYLAKIEVNPHEQNECRTSLIRDFAGASNWTCATLPVDLFTLIDVAVNGECSKLSPIFVACFSPQI